MRPIAKLLHMLRTSVVLLFIFFVLASHCEASIGVPAKGDTVAYTTTGSHLLSDSDAIYSRDSLTVLPKNMFYTNKYVQMTYVGVPLLVGGFATQYYVAEQFKGLRDAYVPTFRHTYDDYMQYAPAAAMLIIKACGVKGRSSWGRMLVSDAFSVALMAIAVNGVKYSVGTMRPDGTTRNSFPSGHTATAFMAAAMLDKEFGCISPWISVGGYTVATAVGVSRILNNRHWISDVLAGAGIGILLVEFGYLFADLIFKEKGLYQLSHPDFSIPDKPSYAGLYMGLSLPTAAVELGNGQRLLPSVGSRMGVEGAWYIHKYWGIGGEATVAHVPVMLESSTDDQSYSIDAATVAVGGYGSCPLGARFRAELKALVGCNIISDVNIIPDALQVEKTGLYYEIGASLSVVARRHFGVKAFCDYGGYVLATNLKPNASYGIEQSSRHTTILHTATLGVTTSILF